MSEDSEELSEVFEEEEEVTIKKIYVSRPIMTLSGKLAQKVLVDDSDADPDDSDAPGGSQESDQADEAPADSQSKDHSGAKPSSSVTP